MGWPTTLHPPKKKAVFLFLQPYGTGVGLCSYCSVAISAGSSFGCGSNHLAAMATSWGGAGKGGVRAGQPMYVAPPAQGQLELHDFTQLLIQGGLRLPHVQQYAMEQFGYVPTLTDCVRSMKDEEAQRSMEARQMVRAMEAPPPAIAAAAPFLPTQRSWSVG